MEPQSTHETTFTFAFQPIVDINAREVLAYEALIRGPKNEPAFQILEQYSGDGRHLFDQQARVAAIGLATRLGISCHLNLNFLPLSLYSSPESVLSTLDAAAQNRLPIDRIVLEVLEGEIVGDQVRFAKVINEYRNLGLSLAIDDFGAGYAGLNFLANFQPDQIKLDMGLIRGIEHHGPKQAIVRALIQACYDLAIDVIAEGVETVAEYTWLANAGVQLFQGYLFARPGFECFPPVHYPGLSGIDDPPSPLSQALPVTKARLR